MNEQNEELNLFQEIGELVTEPVNSAGNILYAALDGNLPEKKDVLTVLGAVVSLWLLNKIF